MNKLFLKELRVVGRNVKDAVIIFDKPVTVITGASDTGKTYIYECIDYVLGKEKEPEYINESVGYQEILLEVTNGIRTFTLKREIKKKIILAYETEIENIKDTDYETLQVGNKGVQISDYLLKKIGVDREIQLKYNKKNVSKRLTYRMISKFTTVNETKIIDKITPIHTKNNTEKTYELSTLRFLLTGIDDSEFGMSSKLVNEIEIGNRKIEFIDEIKKELINEKVELENKYAKIIELFYEESEISKIAKEIERINEKIIDYENKKKMNINQIIVKEDEAGKCSEALLRFNLLKEEFDNEIERVEFINEGNQYIGQLKGHKCPMCDTDISSDVKETWSEDKYEVMILERNKIVAKRNNLVNVIINLENKKKKLNIEKDELINQREKIEDVIVNQISNLDELEKKLQEYIEYKIAINSITMNQKRIYELDERVENINEFISNTNKDGYIDDKNFDFTPLCDVIKKKLEYWEFDEEISVNIDNKKRNIFIGDRNRSSYGKGYRAFIYLAYLVGLMEYCISKNLTHTGFLMIDSPFTSLTEKDKELDEGEIEVSGDMSQAFYDDITSNFTDVQFIIFENEVPKETEKINHIHFTKNSFGRYGFFPMNNKLSK